MTRPSKEKEFDSRIDLLRKRIKDSDDLKVKDNVFDTRTLLNLYALASKGIIDSLGGSVSTGKEANIFYAASGEKDLTIKIYLITSGNFKSMQEYLHGDPRFSGIKATKRAIISAWTKKEFRNLKRAEEAGVRVPHPIAVRDNILVMELIGQRDNPAPQLREVDLDPKRSKEVYDEISEAIYLLYDKAELVHADLSEFNVLCSGGPVLIDMGQSVTLDHPMASKFLARDIANIVKYFRKKHGTGSEEEIWARLKRH